MTLMHEGSKRNLRCCRAPRRGNASVRWPSYLRPLPLRREEIEFIIFNVYESL
jgi:hypothetical protein